MCVRTEHTFGLLLDNCMSCVDGRYMLWAVLLTLLLSWECLMIGSSMAVIDDGETMILILLIVILWV